MCPGCSPLTTVTDNKSHVNTQTAERGCRLSALQCLLLLAAKKIQKQNKKTYLTTFLCQKSAWKILHKPKNNKIKKYIGIYVTGSTTSLVRRYLENVIQLENKIQFLCRLIFSSNFLCSSNMNWYQYCEIFSPHPVRLNNDTHLWWFLLAISCRFSRWATRYGHFQNILLLV